MRVVKSFYCLLLHNYSRDQLVELLKLQYYQLKQKNLPIYGVTNKSLKDYLTTDKDLMRGQTKVPVNFRIWERDIDPTESHLNSSFIGKFDTEYYNQQAIQQNPKIGQPLSEESKQGEKSGVQILSSGNDSQRTASSSPNTFDQVYINNKKLDKYNQKEKIEKEEKNMDSSSAQLIAGSEQREQASLKDFKVIKIIDKGSFGKVFLVV